jgi:hypothetical protein
MKCNLNIEVCVLRRRAPVMHLMLQNSKSPVHLLRSEIVQYIIEF